MKTLLWTAAQGERAEHTGVQPAVFEAGIVILSEFQSSGKTYDPVVR